jgi:hypothetical protein
MIEEEMNTLKKSLAVMVALMVPFAVATSAEAANESVTATTNISGMGGKLYKEKQVASKLNVHAEVMTPSTSPTVLPMKNVKITFPAGMTFRPNNAKTPVCTDSKLSNSSQLNDPAGVVAACKSSVVGTGTAAIYLAKLNQASALITDPILIAFNAGKTGSGQPKVKIYGYSDKTRVGILMSGTLKGSVLDIAVPVLSSDSAVKYFDLNLPGSTLSRPEIGVNVKGLDPNYVQAKCGTGVLNTNAVFELGERSYPSGTPTGPTTTVVSPQTTQNCTGLAGHAKLTAKVVKRPRAVRNGRKGFFRIYVKNVGTATAKGVFVFAPAAKKKVGYVAPGRGKTIGVRAKVRGRKGQMRKIKFTVKGNGVSARAFAKVRVR